MKHFHLRLVCALLISFSISFASLTYAHRIETVVLTAEMIKSAETCHQVSKKSVRLNCKIYHQTTHYTCGPAVVMMLMHYYKKFSSQELNQATELRIAKEMGASNNGTSVSEVTQWLSTHGLHVSSGTHVTTDFIIEKIRKGIPVIIAYDNHWILAIGYNKGNAPEEDEIIFADPCCNTTILSRNTIDSMWKEAALPENHCGDNVGAYIVAT